MDLLFGALMGLFIDLFTALSLYVVSVSASDINIWVDQTNMSIFTHLQSSLLGWVFSWVFFWVFSSVFLLLYVVSVACDINTENDTRMIYH